MSSTCRCCVLTVAVEITSAQCLKFPGCCSGKGSQLNAPSSWRDSLLFLAAGFVLAVLWTGPGIYSGQPQNTDVLWWPFLGSRGPGCHLLDLNQSRIEQHLLLMTVGQRSSVTRRTLGSSLVKSGDQAAAAPASAGTAGSSGNKTSSSSSNNSNRHLPHHRSALGRSLSSNSSSSWRAEMRTATGMTLTPMLTCTAGVDWLRRRFMTRPDGCIRPWTCGWMSHACTPPVCTFPPYPHSTNRPRSNA
eukprot:scpid15290/ scgid10717/ 